MSASETVSSRHRVSAIVPAAGRGERLRSATGERSKNFLSVVTEQGSRPLIQVTVDRLLGSGVFFELILAVSAEEESELRALLRDERIRFVLGGSDRQASVWNALQVASGEFVAIHDAARPLVSCAALEAVVRAGIETGAAILSEHVISTLKRVDKKSGAILETFPREEFLLAQTPQVFRRELISKAHEEAYAFRGTDDAQLVERLGARVYAVFHEDPNPKITTPGDLHLLSGIPR